MNIDREAAWVYEIDGIVYGVFSNRNAGELTARRIMSLGGGMVLSKHETPFVTAWTARSGDARRGIVMHHVSFWRLTESAE